MMRLLATALVLAVSAGCSVIPGLGEKEDDGIGPAPLTNIKTERELVRIWSRSIGNGQGGGFNRLKPAIDGVEIYAASANGEIYALDARSGKTRWRKDLNKDITGAVGLSEDLVLIGVENGDLYAFSRADGTRLWRKNMGAEILAPAAGDNGRVVVHTYDGKIRALDATNGEEIWSYAALVPRLTIRGTSSPKFYRSLVLTGLANGRVIALDAATGTLAWEQRVAVPEGGTEIERLTDVDGDLLIEEPVVYATAFNGNILAVGLDAGDRRWARPASANVGPASGYGNIYVATLDGSVTAYKKTGQDVTWTQSVLARRKLTQPATIGDAVAVGDFDGYLHLLSQVDGHQIARVRVDSDGLRVPMLSEDGTLYVYGNSGKLAAYRWAAEGVRGESIFSRLNPFGNTVDNPQAQQPRSAPQAPSSGGSSLEEIIRDSERAPARPRPVYDRADEEPVPQPTRAPQKQAPIENQTDDERGSWWKILGREDADKPIEPTAKPQPATRQPAQQQTAPSNEPSANDDPFKGRKWWQIFGRDQDSKPAPIEERAPAQRAQPKPPEAQAEQQRLPRINAAEPEARTKAPAAVKPFNLPPSAQELNNEPVTERDAEQRSTAEDDPFNGRKWWQIFGRDEPKDDLPVVNESDEEDAAKSRSKAKPRRPVDDEGPGYEPQVEQDSPRSGRATR